MRYVAWMRLLNLGSRYQSISESRYFRSTFWRPESSMLTRRWPSLWRSYLNIASHVSLGVRGMMPALHYCKILVLAIAMKPFLIIACWYFGAYETIPMSRIWLSARLVHGKCHESLVDLRYVESLYRQRLNVTLRFQLLDHFHQPAKRKLKQHNVCGFGPYSAVTYGSFLLLLTSRSNEAKIALYWQTPRLNFPLSRTSVRPISTKLPQVAVHLQCSYINAPRALHRINAAGLLYQFLC